MTITTLELKLISPEHTAFSREVGMVILPGAEGQFGVLPQHMNLIAEIVPGKVAVHDGGAVQYFYVSSGVAHITSTKCSVLVLDVIDTAGADLGGLTERLDGIHKLMSSSHSESEKADLQADADFINIILQDLKVS
ncbi:MAG: ATP synthase F1 subunit epsilon [Proteobacteria bacterium]|nr:ATP synthase F1 subunit epsilon [Pseudomonadota bacterium]